MLLCADRPGHFLASQVAGDVAINGGSGLIVKFEASMRSDPRALLTYCRRRSITV